MDQYTAARLRAEKRSLKRTGTTIEGREAIIAGATQATTMPTVQKKKEVKITVFVDIGGDVIELEYDAPQFFGTLPPTKINKRNLQEIIARALRGEFGKMI